MCGIVGYVGERNAIPLLLEGLKRLEYRGYDSAGIAFIDNGNVVLRKTVGKLKNLESIFGDSSFNTHVGIGHTRWATHGKPSYINSHPHCDCTGRIVVVHNGIIENYSSLKRELVADGHALLSETDTEVIAHLIERNLKDGNLLKAIISALREVKGTYALAIISSSDPDKIVAVRKGSPLVIGKGNGEYILASDIPAILTCTKDAIFINENELVILDKKNGIRIIDLENGYDREEEIHRIPWDSELAEKGGYPHFMLKEIHEQPNAVGNTYRGKIDLHSGGIRWHELNLTVEEINRLSRIQLISCGTSWHASLIGKFLIEKIARIPVDADLASEFRYRDVILDRDNLTIGITQSGETADTLEAMRKAKEVCFKVLTICNVVGSTAARESDGVIYTHAGPEIGVASTKTFISQIVALYLFALFLGKVRGLLNKDQFSQMMNELATIPNKICQVLANEKEIERLANLYWKKRSFFFLGRGIMFPIALEGALKLKEISYIHAEGHAGGEMKHGSIALVDRNMVVVSLIPLNSIYDKMLGNIEEIKARDGKVIALCSQGDNEIKERRTAYFIFPRQMNCFRRFYLQFPYSFLPITLPKIEGAT
jgi:glutamine---fructose-6-phosphate transaminase (isomerizing)